MAVEITLKLTDNQEGWLRNHKALGDLCGSMSQDILAAAAMALPEPLYRVELVGTRDEFAQARIRLGSMNTPATPVTVTFANQLARILSESPTEWGARRRVD